MLKTNSSISFQVIVADSSSDHASEKICNQFAGFFKSLVYIRHNKIGAAAARNIIAKISEADLLIFLDSDVYVYNDCIEQLVGYFTELPNQDCVLAPSVKFPKEGSKPMRIRSDGKVFIDYYNPDYFVSALILVPKKVYKQIFWNERMKTWYDDFFYCLCCKRRGLKLAFYDKTLADHDMDYENRPRCFRIEQTGNKAYTMLFKHIFISPSVASILVLETVSFVQPLLWILQPDIFHPTQVLKLSVIYSSSWFRGNHQFLMDLNRYRQLESKQTI